MKRIRFSDLTAPGPRLTWQALSIIALTLGLPVAVVLEVIF